MSLLSTEVKAIIEDVFLFSLLTRNSIQTYLPYIMVTKFVQWRPRILNTIKEIDGEKTGARTMGISYSDEVALFKSWTELALLLAPTLNDCIPNTMAHV